MQVDLHELANTPGAGRVRNALRKAGLWQEDHDGLPLWHVRVEATRSLEAVVLVAAPTEEAAAAAVRERMEDIHFEDAGYGIDIDGISSTVPASVAGQEPDLIVREDDG